MQFYSGYHPMADLAAGPMDRNSYQSAAADDPDTAGADSLGIGIGDIGMSVPMGISAPNVQGIYSKIRSGVGSIEIGFPGAIHGNRQSQTPGMYGKDQRQAMREMGTANNVKFTTHAAYQIMGMTGAVEQGSDLYKFDMARARAGQHEVERAIDFAADVSGGGSIVVHTGEFERPLTDMYMLHSDRNLSEGPDGRIMFKKRLTEDKDANFYLIDDRNGQAQRIVEKDRLVNFPRWNRAVEDRWGIDKNGDKVFIKKGEYIDYEGRKVIDPYDPVEGRVPRFNEKTREFESHYMSFEDFKKEAEEKNRFLKEKLGRPLNDYEKTTQTEAFLQATLETQEGHSRGWAGQYADGATDEIETLEALQKAKKFYMQLDDSIPPEEKWKIAIQTSGAPGARNRYVDQLVPQKSQDPLSFLNDQIQEMRSRINFSRQSSISQLQQAQDTAETKKHIVDPQKYVDRFAIRHYAELGVHALNRSKDPNKPLMITMENIFPERFGGHPEELKWLIDKARDKMVDYLTQPEIELGTSYADKRALKRKEGADELELQKQANPYYRPDISKEEARKLAAQHIKATIDTGHLNMWRKYFQPKPGASQDQNEKEFREWYLKNFEMLAKDGYIGNMHLVDNFGYQDDHLAPGQGNAPVKDAVRILQKYGYDGAYTVEPGADASTDNSDFHGLMKTWRYFGAPIYGTGGMMAEVPPMQQQWGQVQYSYFGQGQPPYFVFGSYAPSNDWTLWSQAPME